LAHPDAPLANAHVPHLAPVDHVADRLLIERQQLRDVLYGSSLF